MYPFMRLCTAGKNFAFPLRDKRHAMRGRRNIPVRLYFFAIMTPCACSTPGVGGRTPVGSPS